MEDDRRRLRDDLCCPGPYQPKKNTSVSLGTQWVERNLLPRSVFRRQLNNNFWTHVQKSGHRTAHGSDKRLVVRGQTCTGNARGRIVGTPAVSTRQTRCPNSVAALDIE